MTDVHYAQESYWKHMLVCVCVSAHSLTPCSVFVVSKESAGAVDEEDFIKSFTDVPTVQVH